MNLSDRLSKLMSENPKATIAELSRVAGVSYEMARRYILGTAEPRKEKLEKIAEYFNVKPSWLQFGEGQQEETKQIESNVAETGSFDLWDRNTPLNDDEVEVPLFQEIRLAAGNGFADDIMDYNNFKLRFSRATLRRQGVQYENAVCVVADGNSMEPVIPNGATVGIDTGNKTIRDGSIYAINHGGLLRIKLLYNMPNNQIKIRSYNTDEYDDEIADLDEVSVIGKVFWYSVLL